MWKRRVLSEADKYSTRRTKRAKRRGANAGELSQSHAFSHTIARGFVSNDRDVVRLLHQSQLGRRLEHAAARRDRRGIDILQRWRSLANHLEQEVPHAYVDADWTGLYDAMAKYHFISIESNLNIITLLHVR